MIKFYLSLIVFLSFVCGCDRLFIHYEHVPGSNLYRMDRLWGCDLELRIDIKTHKFEQLVFDCPKFSELDNLSADMEQLFRHLNLVKPKTGHLITVGFISNKVRFPRLLKGINRSKVWPQNFINQYNKTVEAAFSKESYIQEIRQDYKAIVERGEGIEHFMNMDEYISLIKTRAVRKAFSKDIEAEVFAGSYLDKLKETLLKIGCKAPQLSLSNDGILYTGDYHQGILAAYTGDDLVKRGVLKTANKDKYPIIIYLPFSCG